jgi:Zn-dependent peptidase ImmA (M78 family)
MIKKDADRGGSSGYAIYVNDRHAATRRRFSIAHEIAHFALHRSLIGDGITDDALYRSKLSGPIETQANRMAADILMPWHLIRAATDSGLSSVEDLARHFEVSKSTMSIQLGVPFEAA